MKNIILFFIGTPLLIMAMEQDHLNPNLPSKICCGFQCPHCHKDFPSASTLMRHHFDKHKEDKLYFCPFGCWFVSCDITALTTHMRSHQYEKNYAAPHNLIGYTYDQSSPIPIAQRLPAQGHGPLFACTWKSCNLIFASRARLALHLKTHMTQFLSLPYKPHDYDLACENHDESDSDLSLHVQKPGQSTQRDKRFSLKFILNPRDEPIEVPR